MGDAMNIAEAYEAMRQGKRIRRPCWGDGVSMSVDSRGVEITSDSKGKCIAKGYREFTPRDDYEVYEGAVPMSESKGDE